MDACASMVFILLYFKCQCQALCFPTLICNTAQRAEIRNFLFVKTIPFIRSCWTSPFLWNECSGETPGAKSLCILSFQPRRVLRSAGHKNYPHSTSSICPCISVSGFWCLEKGLCVDFYHISWSRYNQAQLQQTQKKASCDKAEAAVSLDHGRRDCLVECVYFLACSLSLCLHPFDSSPVLSVEWNARDRFSMLLSFRYVWHCGLQLFPSKNVDFGFS